MGYEIFTGHRLEDLVAEHRDLFRTSFFGAQPLVVLQNQSLAQWLKLHLADTLGGYTTGDFVFQDEALRRLLDASGAAPERVLFLDDLKFELYRHLARVLEGSDPVFAPLGTRPEPGRLFELADAIAGVFHNYAMNSSLWPRALAEGAMPQGGADPGAFAWQARLWQDLLVSGTSTLAGLVLERLTREPPRPWPDRPRLILVGSAFLSRRAAAFLEAWARAELIDVVQLLLLPAPSPAVKPWPLQRPWSSWGAFGRAFLALLPPEREPRPLPTAEPTTALEALQTSLAGGVPFPGSPPDPSLEILSCPHPLRELELVRDRILAALAADPSLQVHEIAILAPDINVYAPFLDAALGSDDPGRRLKFHVIDLDLGRENLWFRALDSLLALVSGPVDRPTLFSLVDTPAFRQTWDLTDEERDLWLDYTDEVSAWREDGGTQSWTAGSERLYAGWFRSELPGGPPPLDTSSSAFRVLGRFQALIEGLQVRSREARRPRGFLEWVRFFDQLAVEFLGPGDGTASELSGRLRTLALDAGSPEDPLPWSGFRAFVQDQIAHFSGRRGQLLTEGVHCSSLRPLRAIPFRVIAVLGLDEGRFPRQTPTPSFDLRRYEAGQDEVSALALDRYCFWETIMATRTKLILSYQGLSAVDGTERPPSTVLADLMDYLEAPSPWPITLGTVKDFSVRPGDPPTWSQRTVRRAQAANRPSAPVAPRVEPAPSVDEAFPEVRSSEVVQAFTTPARFHLKRVRHVTLADEDRRGVDEEEPWSLGFFNRQIWLQEALRRTLAGQEGAWDVEAFVNQALATGRVRPGVFTERDRRELEVRALQASEWAQGLMDQGWVAAPRHPRRTHWAGRPWAWEPDDRLVRGDHILVPRLLWAGALAVRTRVEVALLVLQDPAPAFLATLNPSGESTVLTWGPDEAQTAALAARAEAYWTEAASRPLALYPDLVATLAKRREDRPDESWDEAVESAWTQARTPGFVRSEATLGRDPYAGLAFAEAPATLAADLKLWWEDLWVPLMEAWT